MAEIKGNAQTRAKNKYAKKTYDDLRIQVKKGKKDVIRAFADKQGKSINGFVNEAIDEKIEREKQ